MTLRVRHGGHGPAVLLLHGHPRTHTTWHRVAPQLARDYTPRRQRRRIWSVRNPQAASG